MRGGKTGMKMKVKMSLLKLLRIYLQSSAYRADEPRSLGTANADAPRIVNG